MLILVLQILHLERKSARITFLDPNELCFKGLTDDSEDAKQFSGDCGGVFEGKIYSEFSESGCFLFRGEVGRAPSTDELVCWVCVLVPGEVLLSLDVLSSFALLSSKFTMLETFKTLV